MMLSFARPSLVVLLTAAVHLALSGCSFEPMALSGRGGATGLGTGTAGFGGTGAPPIVIGPRDAGSDFDAGVCASQSAMAMVLPVYLAFAFDVSGSMGAGDYPWHDRTLKWDPVTAATKAFFADPASSGLSASLTFFPDESQKCSDTSYVVPDVPTTPLPSTAHGAAIDRIGSQDWRGGTPTLHVVRGVISAVQQAAQTTPGRYAIVLVTDGYPQGCSDNAIASVASAISAIAGTIKTYVIGVANPPIAGAPDTVTNLTQIAQAGGTDRAYIIDTGDPTRTATTFRATIDMIRGAAVACDARIPPAPAGSTFDKEKVIVTVTSHGATTNLIYDRTCAAPNSWHYDDPANPRSVVLCPAACNIVQTDPGASLKVEFTCSKQIIDIG